MICRRAAMAACLALAIPSGAAHAAPADAVSLVVAAGRPVRVRLDARVRIKAPGQEITASVVDAVYAYDRVVIPAGATVTGRIVAMEPTSRWSRLRAMAGGDFTPRGAPLVRFDTLVRDDGTRVPIATALATGREGITRSMTTAAADDEAREGTMARARRTVADRTKEAVESAKERVAGAWHTVTAPGKGQRIKDFVVSQLPYHPRYLGAGTMYTAELAEPVPFGEAVPADAAPADDPPAPSTVLTARLTTPLDSSKSPKGTPVHAVLTEPVFGADHRLIYPEGTALDGEVTRAIGARSLHRNGRLRFLIEHVTAPGQAARPMLASVYAVDAPRDDHLIVDDEGGTRATNSNTRFIAPALAVLALRGGAEDHRHRFDGDGDDGQPMPGANFQGRTGAGWVGFGLLGSALSLSGRPVAIAFGVYGAARAVYSNVLGKGREVTFPSDTIIQVQLSPVPAAARP